MGTFAITARLEENGCGAGAVPAEDRLTLDVELRERQGEAFWRRPAQPMQSGVALGQSTYRFRYERHVQLLPGDPDPDFGHAPCDVMQRDVVTVQLLTTAEAADASADRPDAGEGSDAAADELLRLRGTHRIDVTPVAGSDCQPLTLSAGGAFLALPCRVQYTLDGSARSPF